MISIDRVKKILACYGGNPSAWPENERDDVQMVLADSKVLSELQQQELAVDKLMRVSSNMELDSAAEQLNNLCAERIMARLPEQEQVINQASMGAVNKVNSRSDLWLETFRPLLIVASIVLVLTGLFGSFQFHSKEDTELLTLAEYMTIYVGDSFSNSDELIDEVDELEVLAFLEPQLLED